MEKAVAPVLESVQKLIGLHRQLLDCVRAEREALVQAELKGIQDTTIAKQGLIEAIQACETERLKRLSNLAIAWKKPMRDLSLPNLVIHIQGQQPKLAEQLRTAYNSLTILIQRITEQNADNRVLVERSLAHVNQMKKNVLGEAVPKSNTYTSQGQRAANTGGARLISKEA